MPPQVLQRYAWYGTPTEMRLLFKVHIDRAGTPLEAVCRLMSHQLGWELRLEVAGEFQRSQVFCTNFSATA
jgi:hypothetical protein